MKLKGKPRETIRVELGHGVTATFAFLTRKDLNEIGAEALGHRWDADAKVVRREFDNMLNLRESLRRGIPSVSGLTPDAVLALGDIPEHVELDVELAEDGTVQWDHDRVVYAETISIDDPTESNPTRKTTRTLQYTLPMYLYSYGPKTGLAGKFDEVQARWAEAHAEAEKKSMTTSAG